MTNSYKTGTVSVTNGSAVVNGTGTAWAIENVVGGMFRLGTFEAEIIAATNTQLTLDANYTGATASGQAYRIWLQDAQAASNITINRQLGEIIARLVDSAPEIQDFLDAATPGDALSALGVSAFIKTLLDDANQATALATLGANDAGNLSQGTILDARLKASAAIPYAPAIDATTNINTLTSPGMQKGLYGIANANLPTVEYYYIWNFQYSDPGQVTQFAMPYYASQGMYRRHLYGGTWSAWKLIPTQAENDARYAKLSGAAFTGGVSVAGELSVAGSIIATGINNLYSYGGAVYLNPAATAYIWWTGTYYATHFGELHHEGNAARKPQNAAGSGQWLRIHPGDNAAFVLPSGGSWAWFSYLLNSSGGVFSGYNFAGVHAGGTNVCAAQGAGTYWQGFAWRVSA